MIEGKPLCFKRINLEKIKVFDFVLNNGGGGGGGLLKEDVLIKDERDKKINHPRNYRTSAFN